MKPIRGSTATEYGSLSVKVSGYDMTVVEHYSQYIHNLCNRLGVRVAERFVIQLNSISLALNHTHRLKGLNRPYMYETPLTLAPPEGKRKLPSSARKRSRGGTQSGGSLLQGMIRSAKGAIIGIHTYINTYKHAYIQAKHCIWGWGAGRLTVRRVQASSHCNTLKLNNELEGGRCIQKMSTTANFVTTRTNTKEHA